MNAPKFEKMLQAMIATPTMSSVSPDYDVGNRPLIDLLAQWLDDGRCQIHIQPIDHTKQKANLIAKFGTGPGGLILAGHTDTVPYDQHRWRYDPFHLREEAGRFYGLGTTDMKAFLALAIEAMRDIDPHKLRKPIYLVATADEESSMAGAQKLTTAGIESAEYCLIGEPTDLKPVYAHKGILMEAVRLIGQSGHSSDPNNGINAIDGMQRILTFLNQWRHDLQSKQNHDFIVPYSTLNLGHIHGGDNPNRICGECELHFDLRPIPGLSSGDLRDFFHQEVEALLSSTGLQVEFRSLFSGIEPFSGRKNGLLTQLLCTLSGSSPISVSFGTEAPFFSALDIETVVFGPGSIAQAHQENEFILGSEMNKALNIIRAVIQTLCF